MSTILIRNAHIVNRGQIQQGDLFIRNGRLEQIAPSIDKTADIELNVEGKHVIPGIIDDQVHFREPGLTHKATIATESRAAVVGGVTSFMEMPNVKPPSVTKDLLEAKYQIGAENALANYSFYLGATNENIEEVQRVDPRTVCGIKVFMGSSTGNMLVDAEDVLEKIFKEAPMLVATHCEDEATVRRNTELFVQKYGDQLTAAHHPQIRNVEACLLSSSKAVELAKRHNTRLHILHISTADELDLFDNKTPLEKKRITSEVCVHHLNFHAGEYGRYGNQIKCNPAIKEQRHRDALLPALLDNRLDVIATDHAPHTQEEKAQPFLQAPSGIPLIQHPLNVMLSFYHSGKITLEKIVEKMCHAPAIAYQVQDRGFLDEGAWADLAIVDLEEAWTVTTESLLYKCGWSPFVGHQFKGNIKSTIVSGHLAYHNGQLNEAKMGERLLFNR